MSKASEVKLSVCEEFKSLQGEGLHMGLPCYFIRLSGCNLKCSYCDTTYAQMPGSKKSVRALVEGWKSSHIPLVEVTGGEPLLQPGTIDLLKELLRAGAEVLLETNGSLDISQVPRGVVKILDWKTPGSGHKESFLTTNLRFLDRLDQIKFVITNRQDFDFAMKKVEYYALTQICEVLVSPAFGLMEPRLLAHWVLETGMRVRLQLQLHKWLWGDQPGT